MALARARRWMRRLDHSMIFVVLAGTYTTFALIALRGTLAGATILIAVPVDFVSRPWRALVEPQSGRIDRGAYVVCALEGLRDALRRRDVYIAPSDPRSRRSALDGHAEQLRRSRAR